MSSFSPQILTEGHLLEIPRDVTCLVFDLLHNEDLASLSLVCRDLNGIASQYLFRRMVLKPSYNLAKLNEIQGVCFPLMEFVQKIELFPDSSASLDSRVTEHLYRPDEGLDIPTFPRLKGVLLHGHNPAMRSVAVKLLEGHKQITDLSLNFKQQFFLPTNCQKELEGLKSLSRLSVRLANAVRGWGEPERKEWEAGDVVPIWDTIKSNRGCLRSLNIEFPFELHMEDAFTLLVDGHVPTDAALFPTDSASWERPLQLRELKLQHLQNFAVIFEKTKFFDPERLESLSLVDCPGSDGVLVELAPSMKNLKSLQLRGSIDAPHKLNFILQCLPPLETLHLALPYEFDFEYKWLEPQKSKVKYLWLDVPNNKTKECEDFEGWTNLEELAFTKFYSLTGRRPGIMCLKNLKIPANLKVLRVLHPQCHGKAASTLSQEQVTKVIEYLAVRQYKAISAKYPKTSEGQRKKLYVKPNLEILAMGTRNRREDGSDRPKVLQLKYDRTERLGKFKGSFQQIEINKFAREYPKSPMLAYGEMRGPWAWLGKHFTDEMMFSDELDGY